MSGLGQMTLEFWNLASSSGKSAVTIPVLNVAMHLWLESTSAQNFPGDPGRAFCTIGAGAYSRLCDSSFVLCHLQPSSPRGSPFWSPPSPHPQKLLWPSSVSAPSFLVQYSKSASQQILIEHLCAGAEQCLLVAYSPRGAIQLAQSPSCF